MKYLGDANSDAAAQIAALGTFYAGVTAGLAPSPTQLASANAAVAAIQGDLNTLGGKPDPAAVANAGGITQKQAVIGAVVAVGLGFLIGQVLSK